MTDSLSWSCCAKDEAAAMNRSKEVTSQRIAGLRREDDGCSSRMASLIEEHIERRTPSGG